MPFFEVGDYLLIGISIFSHYAFGRRLGESLPFSGTLVGLGLSALFVGALANVCSGLIRPYILITTCLGCALSLVDVVRGLKWDKRHLVAYAILCVMGTLYFALNDPAQVVFRKSSSGADIFRFEVQYSYFSSQSIEMLQASYYDRLKVANMYPFPWMKYHFFNSSTQAIAQGLIRQPSLLTYFMAQIVISILVLLSFAERVFLQGGTWARKLSLYIIWFVVGQTLFSFTVVWNLKTSGSYSVFGLFHLVLCIMERRFALSLLYAFLLGASVSRFLPIAAVVAFSIFWFFFRDRPLGEELGRLRELSAWHLGAVVGFFLYNGLTFGTGVSPQPFLSGVKFSDGWFSRSAAYQWLGYFVSPFFQRQGSSRFSLYNFDGIFDRVPHGSVFGWIFLGVCGMAALWLGYLFLRDCVPNRFFWKTWGGLILFLVAMLAWPIFVSKDLFFLNAVVLPYFVCLAVLSDRLFGDDRRLRHFLFLLFTAVWFYLYSGVDGIKGPLAYTTFDVVLWALGLVRLLRTSWDMRSAARVVAAMALMLVFLRPRLMDLWKPNWGETVFETDVTALRDENFRRSDYVDERNVFKEDFGVVLKNDAYSALLGANMVYNESNKEIANYRWVQR